MLDGVLIKTHERRRAFITARMENRPRKDKEGLGWRKTRPLRRKGGGRGTEGTILELGGTLRNEIRNER